MSLLKRKMLIHRAFDQMPHFILRPGPMVEEVDMEVASNQMKWKEHGCLDQTDLDSKYESVTSQ